MRTFRQTKTFWLAAALTLLQNAPALSHEFTRDIRFDDAKPGGFTTIDLSGVRFHCEQGKAEIDGKHSVSGKQCLRLHGSTKEGSSTKQGDASTVVTLDAFDGIEEGTLLTFRAERWTKRPGFLFRVDQLLSTVPEELDSEPVDRSQGKWVEIYNGDEAIRVGRGFLTEVSIPLRPETTTALRFRCESPPETGILIDNIRLAVPKPQRVSSVKYQPLTLPLIRGKPSPLGALKIETEGSVNPLHVTAVTVESKSFDDSPPLEYFAINTSAANGTAAIVLTPSRSTTRKEGNISSFTCATPPLREGVNQIDLACQLPMQWPLDSQVTQRVTSATLSDGTVVDFDSPSQINRPAVGLRDGGDDGVHTYRIPGLVTSNEGSLLAVYDVRRDSGGDLPGNIDVGLSRSINGGESWDKMRIIMDMGDDPKWKYDGIGDPAILVDENSGTIWVAATWSHGNRSWRGSGPGLKPNETGQLMLVRSDDDGQTWSQPINITQQVKAPEWSFLLQGPGRGITMEDGTLVFAAQYQDPPDATNPSKSRLPHSTILYSHDHGESWNIGTGAFDDTTEAQVAEIRPGQLMLNCRYNRSPHRVVMTTNDMGRTWQEHATSRKALIEPRACMASLLEARPLGSTTRCLLFSNPKDLQSRKKLTIAASFDAGNTWKTQHQVLLDERPGAGYSCMTMIDNETIGIVYEGSQSDLTFQRIKLSELSE